MPKISIQPTPNPDSLKFTLDTGTFIDGGMESFNAPTDAQGHPLGERLFAVRGVANVFILPQFLTITKDPAADWDTMLPAIEEAIAEHAK